MRKFLEKSLSCSEIMTWQWLQTWTLSGWLWMSWIEAAYKCITFHHWQCLEEVLGFCCRENGCRSWATGCLGSLVLQLLGFYSSSLFSQASPRPSMCGTPWLSRHCPSSAVHMRKVLATLTSALQESCCSPLEWNLNTPSQCGDGRKVPR